MSEHEEETPHFDDPGLSTDDLTFAEPGAEAAAEAGPPAEGEREEGAAFEVDEQAAGGPATAEEEHPEAPEEEGEPKKKSLGMAFHAQWIAAILACVAVGLGFQAAHVPNAICHSSYAIAMILLVAATSLTYRIWGAFAITALYTVLLAGALAALMTSVYWLSLDLSMYGWDMKAKQGKQAQAAADTAAGVAPVGPLSTGPRPVNPPAPQPAKKGK
jgi:hypothetical protein